MWYKRQLGYAVAVVILSNKNFMSLCPIGPVQLTARAGCL